MHVLLRHETYWHEVCLERWSVLLLLQKVLIKWIVSLHNSFYKYFWSKMRTDTDMHVLLRHETYWHEVCLTDLERWSVLLLLQKVLIKWIVSLHNSFYKYFWSKKRTDTDMHVLLRHETYWHEVCLTDSLWLRLRLKCHAALDDFNSISLLLQRCDRGWQTTPVAVELAIMPFNFSELSSSTNESRRQSAVSR